MSTSETFIAKFVTQGVEKIDQAKDKIDNLERRVSNLSQALLTVGFGAFIAQALQAADRISDFSDATNISIASLKSLEAAMNAAGGNGKNLERTINSLFAAIENATNGSDQARDAFARVGVSLQDLQNLSEGDILEKVLRGLAELPSGSERAATATLLLSRAFRSVEPQKLLQALDPEKYRASEEATKRAADAQQALEQQYKNLQEGAIRALNPILKLLGEHNLTVEAAEKIVKAFGITFAVIFGAKAITSVLGMVAALVKFNQTLAITAGISQLLGKTPLGAILKLGAAVAGGAGIGVALNELMKQNDAVAESATAAANAEQNLLGNAPGGPLILPANPTEGGAAREMGISPRQRAQMASMQRSALADEEVLFQRRLQNADEITKRQIDAEREIFRVVSEVNSNLDLDEKQRQDEIAARRRAITSRLETEIGEIQKKQNDDIYNYIAASRVEMDRMSALQGASEREKINIEAEIELRKAVLDIRKRNDLSQIQQDQLIAQKRLEINTKAQTDFFKLITDQQKIISDQEKSYRDQIQSLLGNEKTELQKINELIATQPEKYRDIAGQLRDIASIQDRNLFIIKEINTESERQKQNFNDLFNLGYDIGIQSQKMGNEQQRAMRLATAGSEMEKILINEQIDLENKRLEITGRFLTEKVKLAMAIDSEGQATMEQSRLLQDYYDKTSLAIEQETQLSEIRKGNAIQLLEYQREFMTGYRNAFEKYRDDAYNAAKAAEQIFQTTTRGMEDSIVKFAQTGKISFSDMANSIIADIIRIGVRQSMTGLFGMSGLGGIFSNIFGPAPVVGYGGAGDVMGASLRAEGGPVSPGQPYIVGERGPELFLPRSAGTIIPNDQMGGAGSIGGTVVNYNISAVDAASFKQLVARDPQFIYNVTEAGRRSQPSRRLS